MKIYHITQKQLDEARRTHRESLYRGATRPGDYIWNERDSRYEPVSAHKHSNYDFDKGFGIGGINRYQPTAAEEMAAIQAQLDHTERKARRPRRGSRGQLWEPCPICGCEPVCVECGLCQDRHCNC